MYDALGPTHLTTYTHDGFDRLVTTTFPDATHEDLTYVDGSGNLCSAAGAPCTKRNRAGEILTFTYNALDWMLSKVSPNPAVTTSWTYELNGTPATISDTAGSSIAYGYDTAGRRVTESQTIPGLTGTKTVTSTLDASSNRTGLTWADGYAVTYGFDSLNRMTSAADSANTLATYGYDPLSRRTSAAYAGGTSGASYGYSNAGDLLTLTDDLAGTTNDVTFTNTFTPAHQIASAAISNTAFRYTPPSNGTIAYTVNALNQYATLNGTTQLYDARGNITGATSTPNIFVYDAENRMVALGSPLSGAYVFDPLGRRTSKTISGVTTNFVHDGDTEIAEYDGSGNLIRRFVPGPAIDEYIAMVTATGTKTFFTTDKMGSVIAMADLSGNLVEGPYLYDAYGLCRVGGVACNATGVPFRFTGQRLDPELAAYCYRARIYSPGQGRFLQTDPVGYTADINLYSYVSNNPTNAADPSGMANNCGSGNTGSRIQGQSGGFCEGEAALLGASSRGQSRHGFNGNIPNITAQTQSGASAASNNNNGAPDLSKARFTILPSLTDSSGGYFSIFYYQLVDQAGVPITYSGLSALEHIIPVTEGEFKVNNEFVPLYSGRWIDRIGPNTQPTSDQSGHAIALQTFTVRYKGADFNLSTIFKHITIVENGVVTNDVAPVTP